MKEKEKFNQSMNFQQFFLFLPIFIILNCIFRFIIYIYSSFFFITIVLEIRFFFLILNKIHKAISHPSWPKKQTISLNSTNSKSYQIDHNKIKAAFSCRDLFFFSFWKKKMKTKNKHKKHRHFINACFSCIGN